MSTPRYVCLGDIVALTVEETPILGPMQTADGADAGPERRIAFLKVAELTASTDAQAHAKEVRLSVSADCVCFANT